MDRMARSAVLLRPTPGCRVRDNGARIRAMRSQG